MSTSETSHPNWFTTYGKSEYDLTSHILSDIASSNFLSKFPGKFVRISPLRYDVRKNLDVLLRYEVTTIHGDFICIVEKRIEQINDRVLIHHCNAHPSRNGKVMETHVTEHSVNVLELINVLSESVINTMSSLCRLYDSN